MTTSANALRHRPRRVLGLASFAAVVVAAAACSANASPDEAGGSTTDKSTTTIADTVARTITPTSTITPSTSITPATTMAASRTTTTTRASLAASEARPNTTFDELVAVDGTRIHVRCTGHGDTTVVLISGFEAGSEGWGTVEPSISTKSRVCSYDRPGTGTSDPATSTQTFATQASELHELLVTVGETGPYVVVGHSFGGAEAVSFASMFGDSVRALVLVDASPVTWPAEICAVTDDGSDAATLLRGLCSGWSDPSNNREHLDVPAAFTATSTITSLGSLPMTVITAVERELPAGLAPTEVDRLTDAWNHGQQQWSRLSTSSQVIAVPDTSHHIQLDHPDLVISEIVRMLP